MFEYDGSAAAGLQQPPYGHSINLNGYTAAAGASTCSYQVLIHTQEASRDRKATQDQDQKHKKRHRRDSKSICTPDVLRHKIKGAEGQVWTNLSSWTNGRVDTIDFGNGKKKDRKKSPSKIPAKRDGMQSSMTEQYVYRDDNNYHYTYNTSTNAHHALYYMEKPKQQQPSDNQIYSSENKEYDEVAWSLHNCKFSDTPHDVTTSTKSSPTPQASSLWCPATSVQSSNLSSLDSISRWSTVAPTQAPISAIPSPTSTQSSRGHRRGTSLVGSVNPSSSASNMDRSASTTSRRSRARASSSPSTMDPNNAQQYTVLPEKYLTSRNVDELPPSYSLLSCAQPRCNSNVPSMISLSLSSFHLPSHRRAHSTLSGNGTGTGQSYLSRKDLPGKTKEEKWMADQVESVLSSHHCFPCYW